MTFDQAQDAFRTKPTKASAGEYLRMAVQYDSDDMIGDDTFLNAVGEIAHWLKYGKITPA